MKTKENKESKVVPINSAKAGNTSPIAGVVTPTYAGPDRRSHADSFMAELKNHLNSAEQEEQTKADVITYYITLGASLFIILTSLVVCIIYG